MIWKKGESRMSDTHHKAPMEPQSAAVDDAPMDSVVTDAPLPAGETIAQQGAQPDVEAAMHALMADLETWKDKAYRAAADAENTRKRAAADVTDAKMYAVSSFARDVLGVADNLARALAAPAGNEKALRDGVQMVATQLAGMLDKHGVKKVEVTLGAALNPDAHQAMLEVEGPAGQIVAELQPGYTLNGRLLRAALVSVGKRDA
jgi:molecular chaperone GrpE